MAADRIPDELWRAILNNDRSHDHQFVYAIRTTGIFCKPSCKSKIPKKENVRIFRSPEEALEANFRPCKRCMPTDERLPEQAWVEQIAAYLDRHFTQSLTLQTIAAMCHGSPHHLHRTFKRVKGVTPAEYIRQRRIKKSMEALLDTDLAISEIARSVGMPNTAYFITLFKANGRKHDERISAGSSKTVHHPHAVRRILDRPDPIPDRGRNVSPEEGVLFRERIRPVMAEFEALSEAVAEAEAAVDASGEAAADVAAGASGEAAADVTATSQPLPCTCGRPARCARRPARCSARACRRERRRHPFAAGCADGRTVRVGAAFSR